MNREDVTVLIIAQNEAQLIEGAIRSGLTIGRVLVVDGGSTDSTKEVAVKLGARVVENAYQYYAQQCNFGLSLVDTNWVFVLDADERIGATLAESVRDVEDDGRFDGFEIARVNYFLGRPIWHSGWRPDYNIRLLRTGHALYDDRAVHPRVALESGCGRLVGDLHHLTYASVDQYLKKLAEYTTFEVSARAGKQVVLDRRSASRSVYLKLPLKPLVRFAYMYFARAGFLDGRKGLDLAVLSGFYEAVVGMKNRYGVDPVGEKRDADYK